MIDPERHADSRNFVESILRQVPGFRGYLEREYRRESDQLARTYLADQLGRCRTDLDHHQRSLLDAGQIDLLPLCERLRTRLETLESRIRGAVRGYSGFFDYVRVDECLLDQVYAHDTAMLEDVESLQQEIDRLDSQAGSVSPQSAINDLLQRVEAIHRRFDQRAELLEGLVSEE